MWRDSKSKEGSPAELILLLQQGDPAAQRLFWKQSFPVLSTVCSRVLGSGLAANEIAAEVLADFFLHHVHKLKQPQSALTYLKLIASRRARRSMGDAQELSETDVHVVADPTQDNADETAWLRSLTPDLERCLLKLSPRAQQILHLRYYAELPNERIGNTLGCSKQYVGRVIKQSLDALRKCLAKRREPALDDDDGGSL